MEQEKVRVLTIAVVFTGLSFRFHRVRGGLMRKTKISVQELWLKMGGGVCARGAYVWDSTILISHASRAKKLFLGVFLTSMLSVTKACMLAHFTHFRMIFKTSSTPTVSAMLPEDKDWKANVLNSKDLTSHRMRRSCSCWMSSHSHQLITVKQH